MKKIITLFAIITIASLSLLTSCTKEDPLTYELRYTCTSDNPYLVEVNGESDIISGHTYINYRLEKGTYAWKVTQQSGYLLYPTIQEGTVTLDQDREIIFP